MIKINDFDKIPPSYDGEAKRITPRWIYLPNTCSRAKEVANK